MVLVVLSRVQHIATLWTVARQAALSMEFSGKNTGVGCHSLLQEIFPTQGSYSCLLHLLYWKADSLPLCHLGSPKTKLLKKNLTTRYIKFLHGKKKCSKDNKAQIKKEERWPG